MQIAVAAAEKLALERVGGRRTLDDLNIGDDDDDDDDDDA